jgi:tetratricopeptide (TPR) repeat protein
MITPYVCGRSDRQVQLPLGAAILLAGSAPGAAGVAGRAGGGGMSGAERRGRSRGELIRQRARTQFVGRRTQLSLFAENLLKDPESETDPAEFLFHVHGLGGVGKSTLLRQWQETARRAGAVTAVVDENDVHGMQQAMVELARQLAEQAGPLKEFDRTAEQVRREWQAALEPVSADSAGTGESEASISSRVVTQAVLGAAGSLIPGAGAVTAMANPETAAQGLDRLRAGVRARGRGGRGVEAAEVSRAFVSELGRLCGRYRWVVLFFDTWEQIGRYLDGWLRELLQDTFGPLPVKVMVVLAGRDELAEREWAPLRALVADVPLEVFTEAETRALLAARGVTETDVVDAVLQLSLGLPLLVELLALARPAAAEDVDAGGDVVDRAVKRFVQWFTDPRQRETVLACALAPQLNEDVFAAVVPQEAQGLWVWLCEQPFVSGRGDFKQYHAVVRTSMVRQQRIRSPQRWSAAHLRLADTHATWRTATEQGLPEAKRWGEPRWRRHHLDETYHRLCANPGAQLAVALEQAVHAAGQDATILRQWIDTLAQAARDTADPALLSWTDRLQNAVADDEPALASLAALLTHGRLSTAARGWAQTYRGRRLYLADRDEEALAELDRAIADDPHNARAWSYRSDVHRWLGHTEEAAGDLSTALDLDPHDAWALAQRGEAHRMAGRHDEAVSDLTAALDLNPDHSWALSSRGEAHRQAGRFGEAVADFTASLVLDPDYAWALGSRGTAHQGAGRYDEAVSDLTGALALDSTLDWALAARGQVHRLAGRFDEAVTDLTAALDLNSDHPWALAQRGEAHREAGRYDEAVSDLTGALALDPTIDWALASCGQAHQEAGRFDEAVADLTAALDLNPDYPWALAQRGEVHRLAGRFDEAVADLTAALDLNPDYPWALAQRGEAHREAERHDEAVADFTAALVLDPAYAWALGSRGQAHQGAGRYDKALSDLTAALDLDPTLVWALESRGQAHVLAGRHDEAVSDLTAALDLKPAYPWALVERGEAHRQAYRYEQAVADFTAALVLDPDYAWALGSRGRAHRAAGRYDEAVSDLTAALALDPSGAGNLTQRGEAHRQAGRFEDAVSDFTAALVLDPAYTWALGQRGVARRQAAQYSQALEDLEGAVAAAPHDLAYVFEKLMLDTVTSGTAACVEQWTELLSSQVETPDDDATRFFDLFQVLLLERENRENPENPEDDVTQATEAFLSGHPDRDAVTDLLHYLAELSAMDDESGDRARRCRRLLAERVSE